MCVFVYACIERAIFVCSQGQAYSTYAHTEWGTYFNNL